MPPLCLHEKPIHIWTIVGFFSSCPDNTNSSIGIVGISGFVKSSINVNLTIEVNENLSQSESLAPVSNNATVVSYSESDAVTTNTCTVGFYCPADSTCEIRGPAGTVNFVPGSMSIPSFWTGLSGASNFPLASSSPLKCPNGTYSNSTGTTSSRSCTICPVNFLCPMNNNIPKACLANTYSLVVGDSLFNCRCVLNSSKDGFYCGFKIGK